MKRLHREINTKKVKLKNKKTSKRIDLNAIQVPLQNKFDILSDMEEEESAPKHTRIAPVIVTDFNSNIQELITEIDIKCDIKLMSIGRKIILQSLDDKNKLLDALKSKQVNFFSHPDSTNKIFKAMLSGLPEIPTEDILECLQKNHTLTPTKIIMFNTKSFNKLYLCHFNQPNINMRKLKSVKIVHHHIVTWSPYKPKRVGPTQCFKCCMYGHGISSCNRFSVCMLCSGNHTASDCNVITPTTLNPLYKCYNCASANIKHDHRANDTNCPFRAKYELSRNNARNKYKHKVPATHGTTRNFSNNANRFVLAPTPPPLHSSFASVSRANNEQQTQSHTQSIPINRALYTSNLNSSKELWTIAEVTNLLLDSINELKKCTSKLDQLKVIANLLQHACA